MTQILAVAAQVAILYILMAAGILAAKMRWIDSAGASQMTNMVFYFATPCAIIRAFASLKPDGALMGGLAKASLLAVIATVAGIIAALWLFRREPNRRKSVLVMASGYSNCGFMGIPLSAALLGAESVAFLSMYMVVFHIFTWTAGIRLFQPEAKLSPRLLLLNPGVIGLCGGALALLYGKELPLLLSQPINALGALNTPLAMLVMGFYLAGSGLRPGANLGAIAKVITLRQIIIPLAALGVAYLLGLRGLWFMAAMVACAAPPAMNTMLFAVRFNADAPLGAVLLTWANLLSIVTMPIMLGICFGFFG